MRNWGLLTGFNISEVALAHLDLARNLKKHDFAVAKLYVAGPVDKVRPRCDIDFAARRWFPVAA